MTIDWWTIISVLSYTDGTHRSNLKNHTTKAFKHKRHATVGSQNMEVGMERSSKQLTVR